MLKNNVLKGTVKNLSTQVTNLTKENQSMKETILDLQRRNDPEKELKDFMFKSINPAETTVKEFTFYRVHRLPSKDSKKPPVIIAKFKHYKHK